MKKRALLLLLLGLLLASALLVLASSRQAGAVEDGYVALAAPFSNYGNDETLSVAAGGVDTCASSEISYLKFDLRDVKSSAAGSASLVLQATYALSANSGQVVLYAAPDVAADGSSPWRESTLTWQNRPDLEGATKLAAIATPTSAGTLILQSAALAEAINEPSAFTDGVTDKTAGDNVLSLALQIEGCRGLSSVVRFAAREHASGAGPGLDLAPAYRVWLPLLP
jgi:hypothetical protein